MQVESEMGNRDVEEEEREREEQGGIVLFFPFGSDMTKNPRGESKVSFCGGGYVRGKRC